MKTSVKLAFEFLIQDRSKLIALLTGMIFAVSLSGNAGSRLQESAPQKVRVAEGQYKVYNQTNAGGIGPFAPAVYNFTESWTLWRSREGNFEVEGERDYDSPSDVPHSDRFSVRLTPGFRVSELREFRKLRWKPESGPLACQFLPSRLVCGSGTPETAGQTLLDLPMQGAYGFLWPISAFSLGHVTRFVERAPGSAISVEMLSVQEPSADEPVFASVLKGRLKYLGHENISVADRKWQADKFELRVPLHAPYFIWTSRAGLLMDFVEEDKHGHATEQGMKLVRYQQWLDY